LIYDSANDQKQNKTMQKVIMQRSNRLSVVIKELMKTWWQKRTDQCKWRCHCHIL